MKWKYKLNNFIIMLFFLSALIFSIVIVRADTQIVYDTQHMTIQVTSDQCTTLHVACSHKWFINGTYYGSFPDNTVVPVVDFSDINVTLDDPVNTNLDKLSDSQPSWIIVGMTFLQPVIQVLFFVIFIWLLLRIMRKKKR